jgi:hypothetical protein
VAIVDVLEAGVVTQSGPSQTAGHAPVIAVGELAVDEQAESLLERQGLDLGAFALLGECRGHADELQRMELIQGGVIQHGVQGPSDQWK